MICFECGWHVIAHAEGDCLDCPPPWVDPWETWHRAVHLSGYLPEVADQELARATGPRIPKADGPEPTTRTLTALYTWRPAWLVEAHARLDRAVWAAYGWNDPDPAAVPDDEILARLLTLNRTRAR